MINEKNQIKRYKNVIIFSIIFITLFFIPSLVSCIHLYNSRKQLNFFNQDYDLKQSAQWGWVNLTNSEINNQYFSHYDPLPVQGRLYHAPNNTGYVGYTIYLKIDGQVLTQYGNKTTTGGYFTINNYTIPAIMNIYVSHTIEVDVDTENDVIYENSFTINLNSTSEFYGISVDRYKPYLRKESIDITGSLIFDNTSSIPNESFDAKWYTDSDTLVKSDSYFTTATGNIPTNIVVPDDPNSLDNMTLELYHPNTLLIGPHARNITEILVFENVTFKGLPLSSGDAGSTYIITGQAISSSPSSFPIFNRTVRVVYNFGEVTSIAQTLNNGSFTFSFTIPNDHDGTYSYYVELVHSVTGKSIISDTKFITINPYSPTTTGTSPGAPIPPFTQFLIFFIPIVSIIAGISILYGYYFLKKQREDAQVSHIPLEGKINNLKILKDSGRMEESLSYLFNAIFITLIDAKFGRKKKDYETIRDFAIISVKELKLKPSIIYPFITKVEEIIYSRPFEITDEDFYTVVDLFSRVYFELTNYNFILNF